MLNDNIFQMSLFADEGRGKRGKGQYFTVYNPFLNGGFSAWAKRSELAQRRILEPFAGSNNLIEMLQGLGLCKDFASYDIEPRNDLVEARDSLSDFPSGFSVCVTNPPYLARNSAKRRGLFFPDCEFDDLYKFSLKKCLDNCLFVAAIVPASFLNSGLFRDRLTCYVSLNVRMFNDTDHPVCLALFEPESKGVRVFSDRSYIGMLADLECRLPVPKERVEMDFNSKFGELGLFAIDNTMGPSIEFCRGSDISSSRISSSSRSITRIRVDFSNVSKLIKNLNDYFSDFRRDTYDIFLTPFKGLRRDGFYRRRLDYDLARSVINKVICEI